MLQRRCYAIQSARSAICVEPIPLEARLRQDDCAFLSGNFEAAVGLFTEASVNDILVVFVLGTLLSFVPTYCLVGRASRLMQRRIRGAFVSQTERRKSEFFDLLSREAITRSQQSLALAVAEIEDMPCCYASLEEGFSPAVRARLDGAEQMLAALFEPDKAARFSETLRAVRSCSPGLKREIARMIGELSLLLRWPLASESNSVAAGLYPRRALICSGP